MKKIIPIRQKGIVVDMLPSASFATYSVLRKMIQLAYVRIEILESQVHHMIKSISLANRVVIKTKGGFEYYSPDSIIRCEADGNYCRIFFENDHKIYICQTLKAIELQLPSHQFVRVHQSHLLNIHHINRLHLGGGPFVRLINNEIIPISRSRKKAVAKIMSAEK